MHPYPTLSIIVPSFNSGRFLEAALTSIVSQSYAPLEVVVQDALSTDCTKEVLARFGPPVVAISERDTGQADALNRGISQSRSDWIGWLNADDLYLPGAFMAVAEVIDRNPGVEFVFGDFNVVNAEGGLVREYRSSPYDWDRLYCRGCYIFSGSLFFKRSLYDEIGPLDEELHVCMDYDFLLRMRERQAQHIQRPLAAFRVHDAAKSSTLGRRARIELDIIARRYRTASRQLQLRKLLWTTYGRVARRAASARNTSLWGRVRGRRTL